MTYTTLEQSKALIKLGLDEKTADLYYQQTDDAVDRWEVHIGKCDIQNTIPQVRCWSAETLLNILPKYITDVDNEEYCFTIEKEEDGTYSIGYKYVDRLDYDYLIQETGELITVLFKIIEWLLTNKLI